MWFRILSVASVAVWPSLAAAQSTTQVLQQDATIESAEEFGLTLTSGALYSTGDYGASASTDILVVPFSARARVGDFRISAMLPYLRIDGPSNVVGGEAGSPIITDTGGATRVREGWGDLNLSATYTLPSSILGDVDVDLTGRVKFPTSARSKSLGTGETDFAVATELSYVAGTWIPFFNLGYRFFGDPPGADLRNGFTASVGTSAQVGKAIVIVSYDYADATTSASEDSHDVFAALSGHITSSLILTGYGIAGLSRGSPDFGVGLLLSAQLY